MNRLFISGPKTTLVIRNIPRTALVSDVRRLLEKHKVENVQNVYIDHHRFLSVGKAFVTFTHPGHVNAASTQLNAGQLSGFPVDVVATGPLEDLRGRSRGIRGREEAINRGLLTGNGPDAGVRERGKCVVIWGLPGRLSAEELKAYLKGFRLAGSPRGEDDVSKVEIEPDGRPSFTSRHFVRTVSVSEAHRLVRHLHMTPYSRGGPAKYTIRAKVIY